MASLFSNPRYNIHPTELTYTDSFTSLQTDKYSEFELDELIREIEDARRKKRSSLSPLSNELL